MLYPFQFQLLSVFQLIHCENHIPTYMFVYMYVCSWRYSGVQNLPAFETLVCFVATFVYVHRNEHCVRSLTYKRNVRGSIPGGIAMSICFNEMLLMLCILFCIGAHTSSMLKSKTNIYKPICVRSKYTYYVYGQFSICFDHGNQYALSTWICSYKKHASAITQVCY